MATHWLPLGDQAMTYCFEDENFHFVNKGLIFFANKCKQLILINRSEVCSVAYHLL